MNEFGIQMLLRLFGKRCEEWICTDSATRKTHEHHALGAAWMTVGSGLDEQQAFTPDILILCFMFLQQCSELQTCRLMQARIVQANKQTSHCLTDIFAWHSSAGLERPLCLGLLGFACHLPKERHNRHQGTRQSGSAAQ